MMPRGRFSWLGEREFERAWAGQSGLEQRGEGEEDL
jgi:hypothetical protein